MNVIVFIVGFLFSSFVYANVSTCEKHEKDIVRLTAYEPNYFIYRTGSNDENALRVHYSFKYMLADKKLNAGSVLFDKNSIFASYTGEFDFYVGTRESSPVVNRINNPAFHFRHSLSDNKPCDEDKGRFEWIDFSLEHKSNGQAEDAGSPRGAERAARAYTENDRYYFDTVSRSSNFIAMEAKYKSHYSAYAKLKLYISDESEITWGNKANKGIDLEDYDRAKLGFSKTFADSEFSVTWTLGDELLKTDSFDVDYTHSIAGIPFVIRYHNGPMFSLSNYAEPENYIGIGFKLIP